MRLVFKIILFLLSFVLAFTISLGIAGYLLQDQITASTLEFINKNLKSHISVKAIDVSLLKGFPYASVSLTDVEILREALKVRPNLNRVYYQLIMLLLRLILKGCLRTILTLKNVSLAMVG